MQMQTVVIEQLLNPIVLGCQAKNPNVDQPVRAAKPPAKKAKAAPKKKK
jgi:hypothetical protein